MRLGTVAGILIALALGATADAQSDAADVLKSVGDRAVEVDAAVARGLAWLSLRQRPCGGFLGHVGHKRMDGYVVFDSRERQALEGDAHMGVTALCGLAFLADGCLPGRGRYAREVERILDYVLRHQSEFGYLSDSGTRMYSHAFATLFLSQVHGMAGPRRHEVEDALRLAVRFLEDGQNEHGAWRYSPFTTESDLSVTVCQVQALRAARNVGIRVSRETIERVREYIEDSRIPSGRERGAFYYKIYGTAARTKTSYTVNAAAVTTLHCAGVYDPDRYGRAVDYIEQHYDEVSTWYPYHYYYWYGNYYAAQAMHHVGGTRWERFWIRLRDDLLTRQNRDGSWTNDVGPGDEFATAVACLLLRVPAQYLPIFQR